MIRRFFDSLIYGILVRIILIVMVLIILLTGMIKPDWTMDHLIKGE